MIPLILKIRKEQHKQIAKAQDIVIQELFSVFDNAVFHGGTAIWRCYCGNRFSEDIDIYLPKDVSKINILFSNLKRRGFSIIKKKLSENSLYSSFEFERVEVRLEGTFKRVNGHLGEYLAVEGNIITVYTLTPEEFISEKVNAYLGRRKIRDIYDIFFLLRYVTDKKVVEGSINTLIKKYSPPVDENDLKVLIFEGIVPTSAQMLEYIRQWVK